MEDVLRIRLKECLSTVIELEKQLELMHNSEALYANELAILRGFVQKIDTIDVSEEEVLRIENVTERFLHEFSCSMRDIQTHDTQILQ